MTLALRTTWRSSCVGVLFLSLVGSDTLAQTANPATEAALVATLRTGSYEQRRAAVNAIQQIAPTLRSTAVVVALSAEIDRMFEEAAELAPARVAGLVPGEADHGQYLFEVVQALSQMETPAVLPALVKAIGTGNRPMNAIVGFGELAVARVVDVARSESSDASPALLVLARMLERPVRYPLSPRSRQTIVGVARERMSARQPGLRLIETIELAAATGDQELVGKVRAISLSDSPITALGITDVNLIKTARARAAAALEERGLR